MKRLSKKTVVGAIVLIVGISMATAAWSALPPPCSEGKKKFSIYFGNGVANTLETAFFNLNELMDFVNAKVTAPDNSCFSWNIAYNPTAGVIKDLLEAAAQKFKEAGVPFFEEDFWRFLTGSLLTKNVTIWEPFKLVALEMLAKATIGQIDQVSIDRHAVAYTKAVNEDCSNVLLVAHSQGNLYGNSALSKVAAVNGIPLDGIPPDHWRMVSVATPASFVATPVGASVGPIPQLWATSSTDQIIENDIILPFALPFNTSWGNLLLDVVSLNPDVIFGHSFSGYLTHAPSNNLIASDLQMALDEMPRSGCLAFSRPGYSASSASGVATITIKRTGGFSQDESVQFDTADGTATAGSDYVAKHESIKIPKGKNSIDVPISLLQSLLTGSRTVRLSLNQANNSSPGTQLGQQSGATLTITGRDSLTAGFRISNVYQTLSTSQTDSCGTNHTDMATGGPYNMWALRLPVLVSTIMIDGQWVAQSGTDNQFFPGYSSTFSSGGVLTNNYTYSGNDGFFDITGIQTEIVGGGSYTFAWTETKQYSSNGCAGTIVRTENSNGTAETIFLN